MNDCSEISLNVSQMCRLCAAHSDVMIPIFNGEGLQHRIDLKIHLYLPIQVSQEDVLPTQVCYGCASSLMSWHGFFLSCQQAEHKFHVMLGFKDQRHESILMSSVQSTISNDLPPHNHFEFSDISHSSSHDKVYSDVILQTSSTNLSQMDQPSSLSIIEPLSNSLLGDEMVHSHPHAQTVDHGVLDVTTNSALSTAPSADLPRDISNISCVTTADISNVLQQSFGFTHVGTQTEYVMEEASSGQHECNSSKRSSFAKTFCRQSSVLSKRKSSQSSVSFHDNSIYAASPSSSNDADSSRYHNRVSAIQLTNNSSALLRLENGSRRSTSVLVRNESVQPTLPPLEENSAVTTQFAETFVESAVIREHRKIGMTHDSGKGAMVSVVRPTCLRRAPTKVEVLENVSVADFRQESAQCALEYPSIDTESCNNSAENQKEFQDGSVDSPTPSLDEDKGRDPSPICFHCNKRLLLSHEKSHLADVNPSNNFICEFCLVPQGNISEMHMNEVEKPCIKKQVSTMEDRGNVIHQSHINDMKLFKHECKTCRQTFATRTKLSVHLWSHAVRPSHKTFKCHICGKGFMTKSAVMEHRLKHTEEEKSHAFKCVICQMAFGNNTLLGKHRLTHSEEELARPFKCTFCGKAFARNHTLQIHHLTHSDEKSHPCSKCGKGFKMRNSLIQHLRTHQDPSAWPTYPCYLCQRNFKVKSRLRDHLRLHNGDRPYGCNTCGKHFHKVTALHAHEVSHTERRPYMCDICGKAFKWSKNLRQHKSVHVGEEDVQQSSFINSKTKIGRKHQTCQCEICGKELSSKSSLRQHVAGIHNNEPRIKRKSTVCPYCGNVFSSSGGLLRHLKVTHGGERRFKCDLCDRDYATKVALDDHRRSHTGERPYACSICTKTFTSSSNLHIHRLIHSEDRPHKCSYCDKQFKRRAHLVPHIRTHTGEKPYICEICNRGFTQSNDLHKHRLTHSEEKAYVCHCGMAYRVKRDLKRHQTKHHPDIQDEIESCVPGIR